MPSASTRQISTDSRPAQTSAAAVTGVIRPTATPIWLAVTMNGRDVAGSSPDANCRQIVELVSDYLEGDLDADTVDALEAHLVQCPGCLHYVDQIRETIAILGQVGSAGLSPDTQAGLMAAFASFRRPVADPDTG